MNDLERANLVCDGIEDSEKIPHMLVREFNVNPFLYSSLKLAYLNGENRIEHLALFFMSVT